MPNGIYEIGKEAFSDAENLEELYIPDTVEKIVTGAFTGCDELQTIYIPKKFSKRFLTEECGLSEETEIIFI